MKVVSTRELHNRPGFVREPDTMTGFCRNREVLLRPVFAFPRGDVDALFDFIEFSGEHVTSGPLQLILPDLTDLPFLEIASAGAADALATGNLRHCKPVRGRHNVSILPPAELLRFI